MAAKVKTFHAWNKVNIVCLSVWEFSVLMLIRDILLIYNICKKHLCLSKVKTVLQKKKKQEMFQGEVINGNMLYKNSVANVVSTGGILCRPWYGKD